MVDAAVPEEHDVGETVAAVARSEGSHPKLPCAAIGGNDVAGLVLLPSRASTIGPEVTNVWFERTARTRLERSISFPTFA